VADAAEALYLVDGSGFIFRAYHALPPLTTRAGVPSGAVYGFTQMLIRLELDHRPAYLAVVFDAGARSFRNDLYVEYKAHRPDPPDDLKPQFGLVRQVTAAFSVPVLEATDYEADDLIATLARRAREAGQRVVIVSSDKDLMQLVDDRCVLVDTMKNITYGPAEVEEKFGVPPAQLGDLLALMGDSVDNVPGVPGVGPKTACALIKHFGSLDALLQRIDEVPAIAGLRGAKGVADKVRAHVEAARLSRKLVALDEHVALPVELEALRRREPDMAVVEKALVELEFSRLLDRLKPKGGEAETRVSAGLEAELRSGAGAGAATGAATAAAAAAPPAVPIGVAPVEIISTEAALYAFGGEVARAERVAVQVETSGEAAIAAVPIGIALAIPNRPPVYVPLGHRYLGAPPQLAPTTVAEVLRHALGAPQATLYIHDLKDITIAFSRLGAPLPERAGDPMIASYLLDPAADHELAALAERHLSARIADRAQLLGTGKKQRAYESTEVGEAAHFAATEAEAVLALGPLLDGQVLAQKMAPLYADIELPLARVLAVMERHGVRLDVAQLRRLGVTCEEKLGTIEAEVRTLAGADINLGSPKQLQDLLFVKLGLPAVRRTKTGLSTDADVLEELAPLHPVAAKILEHRMIAKLKGTYIDTLPLLVDPKTGRLHTSYKQTIAATGRLSSVEPNLQNVPIRTELGREIRRAFIADEGYQLVVADYSQIELRVLAHLSKDPVLVDAFRRGQDIHERTVIEMFGEEKAADPDMRRVAKMINYGIVYGLSDYGLAQRLGIDRADAKRYIEGYQRTYAGVQRYMADLIEIAHKEGGARTLLGRFRPLPELSSRNHSVRMYGERMARNTPIQGTAADLLKLAMIAVQRVLDAELGGARMLLTVHDELVLEAKDDDAPEIAERLRATMEGVLRLDVPLQVDIGTGRTWADAK
jgi:DNA polymerase-1